MTTGATAIGDFLDALAAKQSTPGGGGAAALTGSQAAALLSMVVNFTLGNKKYADVQESMQDLLTKTEALRAELLTLADEDVTAFERVAACYSMPRSTGEEKAARTQTMQQALKGAARVPFSTAERSLTLLRLVEPVAAQGNTNVVSDAATALYLADAALHSAIINVNINLKFIKDSSFVDDMAAQRDQLLRAAEQAVATGKATCEKVLEIAL